MSSRLQQAGQRLAERWRWFWGIRPAGADTAASKCGRAGEEAAAKFVREKGWKIIARNWQHGRDELDLVAWDGEVMVFAEVRARQANAPVQGYHSVTTRKKRALARAVRGYLRGLASPPAHFRFDIVEVKVSDGTAPEIVLHAGVPLLPNNSSSAYGSHRPT